MCIVWLEGVINQRTSPGYDLSMRRAKLTSIGWHASPKSARCPFEWTEAVVSAIIVVGPQLEKAKGRQLVWSWILGSKVPYLVMVIRSDCLEFGLHNSCPSPSRVTFVACFPFFLLTE